MNTLIWKEKGTKFHKILKWISGISITILIITTPFWLFILGFVPANGGSEFQMYYLFGFIIIFLSLILTFFRPHYIFGILIGISFIIDLSFMRNHLLKGPLRIIMVNPKLQRKTWNFGGRK